MDHEGFRDSQQDSQQLEVFPIRTAVKRVRKKIWELTEEKELTSLEIKLVQVQILGKKRQLPCPTVQYISRDLKPSCLFIGRMSAVQCEGQGLEGEDEVRMWHWVIHVGCEMVLLARPLDKVLNSQ